MQTFSDKSTNSQTATCYRLRSCKKQSQCLKKSTLKISIFNFTIAKVAQ